MQDSVSIVVREDVVSTTTAGEVIILDPELGRYYSLDGVGAFVWRSLHEPVALLELRDLVVATYEVDPDVALADLRSLLRELASARLVDIRDPQAP